MCTDSHAHENDLTLLAAGNLVSVDERMINTTHGKGDMGHSPRIVAEPTAVKALRSSFAWKIAACRDAAFSKLLTQGMQGTDAKR